ncbi:MAG: CHASE domain-containing protein [Actinobacteria bacterium]|nr:CHASE domain-containing protein [Actinomycetota bacterium]
MAPIVAAGVLITLVATLWSVATVEAQQRARLDSAAENAAARVRDRLRSYTVFLGQLRNEFLLNDVLGRQEFERRVRLAVEQDMIRGVQSVEWSPSIRAGAVDSYVTSVQQDTSVRREGYPGFDLRPAVETDVHYPIDYIVPYDANTTAHGFDLASHARRLDEVHRARDTAAMVATPPVRLVQEQADQRGFVLMSPVYTTLSLPQSLQQRHATFAGTVRLVFRSGDLLDEILAPLRQIETRIHDLGARGGPEAAATGGTLLYETTADVDVEDGAAWVDLDVADRRWRVFVVPGARFASGPRSLPWGVALVGLLLTGLLARLANEHVRARDRALSLAADMTEDLREAQERLRALIDHAPDATLVVARDGTITMASRRVRDLFGYDPDDLIGRSIEELLPEEARGLHRAHRGAFIDRPRPRDMGSDGSSARPPAGAQAPASRSSARPPAGAQAPPSRSLVAVRADGSEFPVEMSLAPVGEGEQLEVIAAVRDVSVRREAEELLRGALEHERAAAERLRETDRLRAAFLETVSHELRTPLAAIVGFTEILRRREDDLSKVQLADFIQRIDRNAHRLHGLIAELLDFSRIERAALEADLQPVDLSELVVGLTASLATVLQGHSIELHIEPDVTVAADPGLLERAVTNLLTNAERYSPPGTKIRVTVEGRGTSGLVSVADEGPGIAPDERNLVFERFYRGAAARTRNVPGTGIGLAVVREVIQLMGGTVEVVQPQDRPGATFVITLTRLTTTAAALPRDVGRGA